MKAQKFREIKQTWYECPFDEFKTNKREDLIFHLANKHDIGVKWHKCPHCDYTAIYTSTLKNHLASMHNINVK